MVMIRGSDWLAHLGRLWRLAPSLMALLLLAGAAAVIASTYFGHSPSPYGACYRSDGRAVPCALAGRDR